MKRKQLKVNRAALNFARREASEVRRIGHEDVEAVHSVRIFEKNVHNCLNLCEKINRLNVSFLPRLVVDALRSGRALSKRAGTTPSDALHINVQINDNISPKIRPPKKIGLNDKIVRTVRMLALATVIRIVRSVSARISFIRSIRAEHVRSCVYWRQAAW
jgi:hypothetical protein